MADERPAKAARRSASVGSGAPASPPPRAAPPTLADVAWVVAGAGYAAEVDRVAGTCVAAAADDRPLAAGVATAVFGGPRRRRTRLMAAAAVGSFPRVLRLLAAGADVAAADARGAPALAPARVSAPRVV